MIAAVSRYLHTPLSDIEGREVSDILAYHAAAMRLLADEQPKR